MLYLKYYDSFTASPGNVPRLGQGDGQAEREVGHSDGQLQNILHDLQFCSGDC